LSTLRRVVTTTRCPLVTTDAGPAIGEDGEAPYLDDL
jgi:hypothetical protein